MVLPEYLDIGNGPVSQDSIHTVYDLYWLFYVSEVLLRLQRFIQYDVIRIRGVPAQITHMKQVVYAL